MKNDSFRKDFAEALRKRRRDLGLTQDEMCECLAQYDISEKQYKRAEQAYQSVSISYLVKIAHAVAVDFSGFIPGDNDFPFLDGEEDLSYGEYDRIKRRFFYPWRSDMFNALAFQERNLFRFFTYAPLIPILELVDLFYRIRGQIIDRERYFTDRLSLAIESIPESPALEYARFAEEYYIHVPDQDPLIEDEWQRD